MKKAWVLSYTLSAQGRLWSDWADAQAYLSFRWVHSHFVGFVMSRLKWKLRKGYMVFFFFLYILWVYITGELLICFKKRMCIIMTNYFFIPFSSQQTNYDATSICLFWFEDPFSAYKIFKTFYILIGKKIESLYSDTFGDLHGAHVFIHMKLFCIKSYHSPIRIWRRPYTKILSIQTESHSRKIRKWAAFLFIRPVLGNKHF